MARTLTIDILYDSLQMALEKDLIQEWSVAGVQVVFTRSGQTFSLPVLEAKAYLQRLFREELERESEKAAVQSSVIDMRARKYVLEGLLDDDLGLENFRSLVNIAVRDLVKTKSKRLKRVQSAEFA